MAGCVEDHHIWLPLNGKVLTTSCRLNRTFILDLPLVRNDNRVDFLVLETVPIVVEIAQNIAVVLAHAGAVYDGNEHEYDRQHEAKEGLDALRQSRPPWGTFGVGLFLYKECRIL